MNEVVHIYTLADPRTGEIRYVGKTVDIDNRIRQHIQCGKRCHSASWIKNLKASGVNPIIEVVESFINAEESEWQEAERFWIESFRHMGFNLTNLRTGGIGGGRMAESTKKKLSIAKTGKKCKKNPESARKLKIYLQNRTPEQLKEYSEKMSRVLLAKKRKASQETKARQSIAMRNLPIEVKQHIAKKVRLSRTPDVFLKISASLKGRKLTPEHRAKLSAAKSGWKPSPEILAKSKLSLTPEVIKRRTESIRKTWAAKKSAIA